MKLCAFDLDGTLLNSKKKITSETIKAISALMDKGYAVTIITGRSFHQVEEYRKKLKITLPAVFLNGAMVGHEENWMHREPMDPRSVLEVLAFAEGENHFIHLYDGKRVNTQAIDGRVIGALGGLYREGKSMGSGVHVVNHLSLLAEQTYKILIPFASIQERQAKERKVAQIKGLAIYSSGRALEIAAQGTSKGKGLALLADRLGFQRENVIVFGDQTNDESMFDFAGTSIAMGNAIEALKEKATYVTDTNDQEGIAKAIHRWVL